MYTPGTDRGHVGPSPTVLYSVDFGLVIALDTCGEIYIGQTSLLNNVRLVQKPVFVEGIGGICAFGIVGDFLLAGNHQATVFAVEKGDLPPDFHVLLGTADLLELSVSLDFALCHQGCSLSETIAFGKSPYLSTVSLAPRLGFVLSGVWTVLASLLSVVSLAWCYTLLTPTVCSAIEPQALALALIAAFLARLSWLLLGAIGPSRVPLPSSVLFAPGLAPGQRALFRDASYPQFLCGLFGRYCLPPASWGGKFCREYSW